MFCKLTSTSDADRPQSSFQDGRFFRKTRSLKTDIEKNLCSHLDKKCITDFTADTGNHKLPPIVIIISPSQSQPCVYIYIFMYLFIYLLFISIFICIYLTVYINIYIYIYIFIHNYLWDWRPGAWTVNKSNTILCADCSPHLVDAAPPMAVDVAASPPLSCCLRV